MNDQANLKGIRGWLLFLCVFTVILAPVATLLDLAELSDLGKLLALGLTALSVLSGVLLWSGKREGVVLMRASLILALAVGLLSMSGVMPLKSHGVPPDPIGLVLLNCGVKVAWLVYLSVSKRVKATYYE